MAPRLAVISGPDKGSVFPVSPDAPVTVGRGRQALARLADRHVSRVHCRIAAVGEVLILTDAGSTAGTFLNGRRIGAEEPLAVGDVIHLGETDLRVEEDDLADEPTLPPPAAAASAPEAPPAAVPSSAAAGPRLNDLYGKALGPYEIGPARARGGSGLVFRARDRRSGEDVALKVIRPEFVRRPEQVQRFLRAALGVAPLCHPNIVRLREVGREGPYCWIAMDYIEGESLRQVIDRIGVAGMLDWRFAARAALDVGRALQFIHSRHVIHRNLTPQNVLVRSGDGAVLLSDLVLAKALEESLAVQITRPGEIVGDVRYLSPERVAGTEPVDERSDIYSLGALVYALLAGRPPLVGSTLLDTLALIRTAEPVPPRQFQLSISGLFEGVVMKMLAKRPEERFQSADEMLLQLGRAMKYHA